MKLLNIKLCFDAEEWFIQQRTIDIITYQCRSLSYPLLLSEALEVYELDTSGPFY